MYDQDLIDAVKQHADIVQVISSYIPVTKKGRSYVALCPFHDDKHPSLSINVEKQIFKCFVCGTGGNVFSFVQKYEKIGFEEAVRKVADLVGYHDERLQKQARVVKTDPKLTPLINTINDLQTYYRYALDTQEGEKAREYLKKRNLTAQVEKYGIGYAPEDGKTTVRFLQSKGHSLKNIEDIGIALVHSQDATSDHNAGRLIFPLRDPFGQVVGFSARQLEKDGTAKYINSPDGPLFHKGNLLYNYANVRTSARHDGYCYLLEGFMDVMALDKAGLPNAVALMGTSLTVDQVKLLKRLNCEIRLCLDGDEAGQKAMMKNLTILQKADVPFRIVSNPGDLRDPDDILQGDGVDALKEAMNHLVDAYDFQIDYYINTKKLDTPEERKKVITHFLPFLRNVEPGIERDNYVVKLAKATGYEVDAIYREVLRGSKQETTLEGTVTFREKKDVSPLSLAKDPMMRRLFRAEREILYYMLQKKEAVTFFEDNIETFYNEVYEKIANYIVDYMEKYQKQADVSSLLSEIAANGGSEESDSLSNEITTLAMESNLPPYSEEEIQQCAAVIKEEKGKIYEKRTIDRSLDGKAEEDKVRLINEYAKKVRKRFEKK